MQSACIAYSYVPRHSGGMSTQSIVDRLEHIQNEQFYRAQLDAFVRMSEQFRSIFKPETIKNCPEDLKDALRDMLNCCDVAIEDIGAQLKRIDEENYVPSCDHCGDTNSHCEWCVQ